MRRRATIALLATAGIGVGMLANVAEDRWEASGPTSVAVPLGEDVQVGQFQVHVGSVTATSGLTGLDPVTGEELLMETDGVFVVVELAYATVDRPRSLSDLVLRDARGRTYPVSPRAESDQQLWLAATDLWVAGQVFFEIPADALGELSLQVLPESSILVSGLPTTYGLVPVTLSTSDVVEPVALLGQEVLDAGDRP